MWGAIANAVGNLVGAYADRQEARHSAKQQYTYNSWLQQQNIDFQREMAKNAHQYEIEDLKKSGLNPVISAMGSTAGNIAGSSAPQGTSTGTASTNFGNITDKMATMITATSGQQLNEKLGQKTVAETNNINENNKFIAPLARAKIKNDNSQTAKNTAEIAKIESEIKLQQAERLQKEEETKRTKKGVSGYTFGTDPDDLDTALNIGILGAGAIGLGMSSAKDWLGQAMYRNKLNKSWNKGIGSLQ